MTTIKSLEISANLWRDHVGNTYHRVRVTVDGRHDLVSPVTYGYGWQYLCTAGELLLQAGLAQDADPYDVIRAFEEAGVKVAADSRRVSRKRDL